MRFRMNAQRKFRLEIVAALGSALVLAGCGSGQGGANQMTSFSANTSATDTPVLFTIPQDQMSHVQVINVQPTKITRTLRHSPGAASLF